MNDRKKIWIGKCIISMIMAVCMTMLPIQPVQASVVSVGNTQQTVSTKWCSKNGVYVCRNGKKVIAKYVLGEQTYYVRKNGKWKVSSNQTVKINKKIFYNAKGRNKIVNRWTIAKPNKITYFVNKNGKILARARFKNRKYVRVTFVKNGKFVSKTGWITLGKKQYYVQSGKITWIKTKRNAKGKYYYVFQKAGKTGYVKTSSKNRWSSVVGKWYFFSKSGNAIAVKSKSGIVCSIGKTYSKFGARYRGSLGGKYYQGGKASSGTVGGKHYQNGKVANGVVDGKYYQNGKSIEKSIDNSKVAVAVDDKKKVTAVVDKSKGTIKDANDKSVKNGWVSVGSANYCAVATKEVNCLVKVQGTNVSVVSGKGLTDGWYGNDKLKYGIESTMESNGIPTRFKVDYWVEGDKLYDADTGKQIKNSDFYNVGALDKMDGIYVCDAGTVKGPGTKEYQQATCNHEDLEAVFTKGIVEEAYDVVTTYEEEYCGYCKKNLSARANPDYYDYGDFSGYHLLQCGPYMYNDEEGWHYEGSASMIINTITGRYHHAAKWGNVFAGWKCKTCGKAIEADDNDLCEKNGVYYAKQVKYFNGKKKGEVVPGTFDYVKYYKHTKLDPKDFKYAEDVCYEECMCDEFEKVLVKDVHGNDVPGVYDYRQKYLDGNYTTAELFFKNRDSK